MAFRYFQFTDKAGITRDGVIDDERQIQLLYVASRPDTPFEFKLISPDWQIPVFIKDGTPNVPGAKRDVVWNVERVCLWSDNLDQADLVRTELTEALKAYSGYYNPETIQTIEPCFKTTIWKNWGTK